MGDEDNVKGGKEIAALAEKGMALFANQKEESASASAAAILYDVQPRSWRRSNFMRLYGRSPREPCLESMLTSLLKCVDSSTLYKEKKDWERFTQLAKKQSLNNFAVGEKNMWKSVVIAQWTGVGGRGREASRGKPLFAILNEALIEDNIQTLRDWMPFIRVLNNVLYEDRPDKDLIVYRGRKYTRAQARQRFVEGRIMRACMYVAASLDQAVARAFAYDKVCLRINVPRGLANASPIYKLSQMSAEREVLFTSYSAFRVVRLVESGDELIVELDALDNMIVDNFEQIPTHADLVQAIGAKNHHGPVYAQPL